MMRAFGCFMLVLLAVAAGWFLRDRMNLRDRGAPAAGDTVVVWEPITTEGAERARKAIEELGARSAPVFASLRPGDVSSYIFVALARRGPAMGVVMFWLCALLAIAGALTRRARRIPFHVAAVPVLLWLSVVFLAFETPRYRTGIDPFVVLLAAVALVAAWDVVRSGSAAGPARRPRAASTARYTGSARGRPDPGTGSRSA